MTLAEFLLALFPAFFAGDAPLADVSSVEGDIEAAVATVGTLQGLTDEETARLVGVFAKHESGFHCDAVGDHGRSIGVMQVQWLSWEGHTRAAILGSCALGYELGLRAMHTWVARCGSVERGLGGYATGRCGSFALVRSRCREAQVNCKATP